MLKKLGKYEIESELGRGAMGVVYRAVDTRLGRPVALKTMSPQLSSSSDLLKRFYREAQAAGQLRHPNIVTIYDIDEADGTPFIAMELLDGENLEKIIQARRELPLVKKLNILIQTCHGLHFAHQNGVVHRDIKPANIVVLRDERVKIVDFGIARLASTTVTRTGTVMGTVLYMAPELVRGQGADDRADIFSTGVILFELLTYRNPFYADNIPATLFKIVNEPHPALTDILPRCPRDLEAIVDRALAKDPEERYQSADEFGLDLSGVAAAFKNDLVLMYLQQGRKSLDERNLSFARDCLQRVLQIDSSHGLARDLLSQVQRQVESQQRVQKIEQYMHLARQALDNEQYAEALLFADEALRIEPEHAPALEFRSRVIARRDRNLEISQMLQQAESLAAGGDFEAAKAALDRVLSLDRQHHDALRLTGWLDKELAGHAHPPQPPPPALEPSDTATKLITREELAEAQAKATRPVVAAPPPTPPKPAAVSPLRPPLSAAPTPAPRPAAAPPSRPAPGAEPKPVPPPAPRLAPVPPKPAPGTHWLPLAAGAALVALLAVGLFAAWKFWPRPIELGYVQVNAAPWAEIVRVNSSRGETLALTGLTPIQLVLPPGHYVIELKNGDWTGAVEVDVEGGRVASAHYVFPQVKTQAVVDELVASY
jgi:serine/threonine protein kinase